jgi:hypothetical protein
MFRDGSTQDLPPWPGRQYTETEMDEVERLLPNGFHDALLRRLSVDYEASVLRLEIEFWIGDMADEERREIYRPGRVTVTGLGFLIIDNPCKGDGPFTGKLWIDGGAGDPETSAVPLPPPESGAFRYWLFVDEWNGFIRFAGRSAGLEWLGDEMDRRQTTPRGATLRRSTP